MHEFALADELIRSVVRLAASHPGPIREVELEVGALTALNAESLQTAFEVLQQGTRLAGCRLIPRAVPVVLACAGCGAREKPEDPLLLRCVRCGSAAVEVVSGRQLDIVRIQVEEEDDPCTTS